MKIEHKTFKFKIKEIDEEGKFTGYASTWDIDLGADQFKKGAWKKTLRENKGKVAILDHHSTRQQLGWNLEAEEDEKGLLVLGQLNLEVQLAREKRALMKQAAEIGAVFGLSVGFSSVKWEVIDVDGESVRLIKEARLFEYSIVVFPMNPSASITGVKSGHEPLYLDIVAHGVEESKAREFIKSLNPSEPGAAHSAPDNEPILKALNDLLTAIKR